MVGDPETAKAPGSAMEPVRAVVTESEKASEVADWEKSDQGRGSVVHPSPQWWCTLSLLLFLPVLRSTRGSCCPHHHIINNG